ncbi:MAG: hypothetical protein KF811_15780 [Dokdonella sp.]|nr:hypothetical protein [Dokdonella sp.]
MNFGTPIQRLLQLERWITPNAANRDSAMKRPTPRRILKWRSTIALLMTSRLPENQTPNGCASKPETPRD